MEVSVEVASVDAFVEVSVEASVEAFMEVSVEVASVEVFMEASGEASVEAFMPWKLPWKLPCVRGRSIAFMEASTLPWKLSRASTKNAHSAGGPTFGVGSNEIEIIKRRHTALSRRNSRTKPSPPQLNTFHARLVKPEI